ncbi:TetR/AcrR family transcriptional regulator C-terminal domain-containing protein [Kitasatospora sp. CMC57]|uniref:TetR/AcrR family transcriptional regulator C-terminal domain-containing protein n=1 Tax=Kitasatospora sp. CMC57 TaxID=3231513 RepID=A0AB33JTZ0_9ACTN
MTREPAPRAPLSRERVLRAAVALADATGIDALSMRRLAQELGVVPMALYKHVANKDELLDGMVDCVLGEIGPAVPGPDWRSAVRARILAARSALLGHPWASQVIQSRPAPTPALLGYTDSVIGLFRTGGFSVDLTHHAMHALGSRMLGFTQELFDVSPGASPADPAVLRAMAAHYPYVAELATAGAHDEKSVVGPGCDDQFEFEFALDLLLDGLEGLRQRGWSSAGQRLTPRG